MAADARLTRRALLAGGAAATGYALAAGRVSAEAIATSSAGLAADVVEIPVAGAPMLAYRAVPADAESPPVVLVVHEIFGLHEYIRDVCRRLAHRGYMAIAPDLYRRVGDATQVSDVGRLIETIVAKVPDETVLSDLDAALAWARGHGGDPDVAFVTGFCWGGRIVWLYAAHRPELAGGVAWYGRLEGESRPAHPRHPIDLAAGRTAPVLGLYGGRDRGIPLESVERMRKRLAEAGRPSEIVVFPSAPHGFHADYRATYHPFAAEEGWRRLLAWLHARGGLPRPGGTGS